MPADKLSESFQAWNEKRRDEVSAAADVLSHALVNLNITKEQAISLPADTVQMLAHLLRTFPLLMHNMNLDRDEEIPESIQDDFDNVEHLVVQLARKINAH